MEESVDRWKAKDENLKVSDDTIIQSEGMQFYRCILCGHVVSVWDIKAHHGCPKCRNPRIKPSELSFWEKIVELVKHPQFWKWHEDAL